MKFRIADRYFSYAPDEFLGFVEFLKSEGHIVEVIDCSKKDSVFGLLTRFFRDNNYPHDRYYYLSTREKRYKILDDLRNEFRGIFVKQTWGN